MKKRVYSLFCRLWRRYIYPTESLWGTWGLMREYGKNAGGSFDEDCTLLDRWMILEVGNGGYWDERGETQNLRWHRIGCRRIVVDYSGFDLSREIVRLTRDELWLKHEFGNKDEYWCIECYRRGTPPPDPEPIYERYCSSLDSADDRPPLRGDSATDFIKGDSADGFLKPDNLLSRLNRLS